MTLLETYLKLKVIAEKEFPKVVKSTSLVGGKSGQPNKIRIYLVNRSFLDVWLSVDGDYSYHWESRLQDELIHRWDNAPDHPELKSFPHNLHDGCEDMVVESALPNDSEKALKSVLEFISARLVR